MGAERKTLRRGLVSGYHAVSPARTERRESSHLEGHLRELRKRDTTYSTA